LAGVKKILNSRRKQGRIGA